VGGGEWKVEGGFGYFQPLFGIQLRVDFALWMDACKGYSINSQTCSMIFAKSALSVVASF
jgi:hypothetical protein